MRQKPNIHMWKVFNYGKKKNATKIYTTGLENGMKKEGRQLAHPLKFLFVRDASHASEVPPDGRTSLDGCRRISLK